MASQSTAVAVVGLKVPSLVGIYSPSGRSGKGVVADFLINRYGYRRVQFSRPIKVMFAAYAAEAGLDRATIQRCLEGDLKEEVIPELGLSFRQFGETIGKNWGREIIDLDFWVHRAFSHVDTLRKLNIPVVIDDLRFSNEYYRIKSEGGLLLKVIRPEENGGRLPQYPSEGLLEDHEFDYTFVNEGDKEALEKMVGELFYKELRP